MDRERKRISAVLLSAQQKVSISELSDSFSVSENTIKSWFDRYEQSGLAGLLDKNMAHKKSSLVDYQEDNIISCVKKSPQNLSAVVADLAITHQIKTNESILRRYLKKSYRWKRVRKSLKSQRKSGDFELCSAEIMALKAQESAGEIALWFSDETARFAVAI